MCSLKSPMKTCTSKPARGPLARSSPTFPPGPYTVTLQKDGFGPKRGQVNIHPDRPHHFRLLAHPVARLRLAQVGPSGRASRVPRPRARSLPPRFVALRLAKKSTSAPLGWFDEHGPRATMQITPDGDYTQTGVMWNKFGYTSPSHKQFAVAPERSWPLLLPRQRRIRRVLLLPLDRRPSRAQRGHRSPRR